MSTILKAQQKKQGRVSIPLSHNTFKGKSWILWGLVTFVVLLSVALYDALHQKHLPLTVAEPIPLEEKTFKAVSIVHFVTQPLPLAASIDVAPVILNSKVVPLHSPKDTKEIDYKGVSVGLTSRFKAALLDPSDNVDIQEEVFESGVSSSDLSDMPRDFQRLVPVIHYDAHMYSSLASERFIKINGKRLKEGMFDSTGKLQLLEIQPQLSIFRVNNQSFSLQSLVDWKGF
ncbi:general secretion pathway protein B [Psychromonas sp. CNPT3]|uniref:general secretion pathway protein GspB n=1 Tax=Psychromonas sp. CNPT3 TaxID=314282 RepID=UPI00006E506D|nr:general secretion pathway protein GspB [Psychromonas sp. CNPT3]AGH82457.1 general secretion pathway protein B [Psychromonas sp. CNPT3]